MSKEHQAYSLTIHTDSQYILKLVIQFHELMTCNANDLHDDLPNLLRSAMDEVYDYVQRSHSDERSNLMASTEGEIEMWRGLFRRVRELEESVERFHRERM